MVDVFISYKREQRARAKALAETLTEHGYSVWWDVDLLPGDRFAKEIEAVINKAKVAVVLWTRDSIDSRWVLEEATEASKLGILFPILLDDVEPPFGFRSQQAYDLRDWDGQAGAHQLDKLVDALERWANLDRRRGGKEATAQEHSLSEFKVEAVYWRSISEASSQSAEEYETYLERFGESAQFADLARARIISLEKGRGWNWLRSTWKAAVAALGVGATIVSLLLGMRALLPDPNGEPDGTTTESGSESSFTKEDERYMLTLRLTPPDANVDIIGIDRTYSPGMQLPSGDYQIVVAKSGYATHERTLKLHEDTITSVTLIEHKDEPELRNQVVPVYPARALSRGIEGYVIVEFDVKRNGRVSNPNVVDSSSSLFERAAVQAVMQYEYLPRLEEGIPVDTPNVRERVTFILPSELD